MNAILGFTEVLRRGGQREPAESARHLDDHPFERQAPAEPDQRHPRPVEGRGRPARGRSGRDRAAPRRAPKSCRRCSERAEQKGLRLALEFAQRAAGARSTCDPARLRQILTNLIGNAIKFTERGASTWCCGWTATPRGAATGSTCSDSGIGIPADKLESVFEPFVQAEASTTRRFGGTGLGLTISRGFARAMGGDIVATQRLRPGHDVQRRAAGRRPRRRRTARARAPAQRGGRASRSAAAGVRWAFPPAHVLVVDDGAENRQLVRILLEEVGLRVERGRERPGRARPRCRRALRPGADGHADAGDGRPDRDPHAARARRARCRSSR